MRSQLLQVPAVRVLLLLLVVLLWPPQQAAAKEYAAIFNFGDSLVDAGNLVVDGIPDYLATGKLPYGMTYFGYPTGRCSDGRLVIDFIAQELGLPLLPPSKARNATFHHGANFAITGATALDTSFFVAKGLGKTVWNSGSLHTQIKWLQDMKASICNSPQECRDLFRRSLFIVGEFGGNDYNSPLFAFKPLSEVHEFVPHVVDAIGEGIEKLIAEGAVELVVPGVLPIGCFPVYLSIFRKQPEMYGARSGCIRDLNTLSWVHNAALQRKIVQLRAKHPDVRIMYADYYTPAIQFVIHAEKWGEYNIVNSPSPPPSSSLSISSQFLPLDRSIVSFVQVSVVMAVCVSVVSTSTSISVRYGDVDRPVLADTSGPPPPVTSRQNKMHRNYNLSQNSPLVKKVKEIP